MFKSTQNNFALSLLFAVVLSASTSSVFGMGFVDRMKTVLPSSLERSAGSVLSGTAASSARHVEHKFAGRDIIQEYNRGGFSGVMHYISQYGTALAPAVLLGALAIAFSQDGAIGAGFAGVDVIQAHAQDRGYYAHAQNRGNNNARNYRHNHGHGLRYRF